MFTIVVGIIFLCLFPKSITNPVSILGFSYFNERESYIIAKRVLLDDPSKVHVKPYISREEMKRTVRILRNPN